MTSDDTLRSASGFSDRLADRVRATRSCLVVGLDPVLEALPRQVLDAAAQDVPGPAAVAAAFEAWCSGVLDATAPWACACKVQAACFEVWGAPGWAAYARVVVAAQELGLPVIVDAKRGDVGHTARQYAAAHMGSVLLDGAEYVPVGADAMTVSPYLGGDALGPFLSLVQERGKGLFVLARTSNPGSGEFQDLHVGDPPRPLYEVVAGRIAVWGEGAVGACGLSSVGAVAGATHPQALARLRAALPRGWFLVPGVGAQGGRPKDLAPLFLRGGPAAGLGVLVAASRSVAGASSGSDWREAAAEAARGLAAELAAVQGGS